MTRGASIVAGQPADTVDQEFWAFFQGSSVALYLAGPDGALMDLNPAAAKLLGDPDRSAHLKTRPNIFDWRKRPEDRRAFARLLEKNEAGCSITTTIETISGAEIAVEECAFRTGASRIIGSLLAKPGDGAGVDDVSAMARDLERAKLEVERANRLKSEFLANLSHELRTPLNGIIGGADIILSRGVDATTAEFAAVIRQSGEQLLSLLNDVLDLSKIEAGHMAAHFELVDLDELLAGIKSLFAPIAAGKGLMLRVANSPDAPALVETDGQMLRRILGYFLHNAVKFTEKGQIDLSISVYGEQPKIMALSVRDTGCGMSEDALDRIFMPFEQVESGSDRRSSGAGIGLTLAVKLAALIGGAVSVSSKVGAGSVFTLRLPLIELDSVAMEVDAEVIGDWRADVPRQLDVLVVDDVPTNVMIAAELIKQMGYRPAQACNGLEALERFKQSKYHAVLMDVSMPEMDGVAATAAIRALGGEAARTPIIAVTANVFPGDRERYLQAGMNGYVAKPLTAKALREEFERVMGRK